MSTAPLSVIKPGYDSKLFGTQKFDIDGFRVTVFVNCVTEKSLIKKHTKSYGLDNDPPSKQSIKKFGLRLDLTYEGVSIFRNDKFDLSLGSKRWVFNVKHPVDKVSVLYAIAVEVVKAEEPVEVNFTKRNQIDAALAAYKAAVELAEKELRSELQRIYLLETEQVRKVKSKKLLRRKQ